jgi:hypothetical protein
MVEHSGEHRDTARFRSGPFQEPGGFGARGSGCQNVIDDEQSFALNDMRVLQSKCIQLIVESLADRDSFLWPSPPNSTQDVKITGDIQLGCDFGSDNGGGIKMPQRSLSPVLGNWNDSVDPRFMRYCHLTTCQQGTQ